MMRKIIGCLSVATIWLATSALAQKEQWLQYQTGRGGYAYRWLELTTNPPPGVTLPKFNAKPYFALWTTPLDPKGRWICFDRTRRSGPYDRLIIDATGDGKLDAQKPIGTTRLDQYSAAFEPARLVFKGEDGPIAYHLVISFMKYADDDIRALASPGGHYAGRVDFGGKTRRLQLVDGNVNGCFSDLSDNSSECDRVIIEGDKAEDRFLGQLVEVDDQLFRVEVARDGAFVKIQKAENVTYGQVRVPEAVTEFAALGKTGHFIRKPAKGELTLPAGEYRIYRWLINRKDDKGASWELTGTGFADNAAVFEVAAGKPTTLAVGEPLHILLQPRESRSQMTFDLKFQGHYGETVSVMKGKTRPSPPRLTLTSLDGSYRYTNSFEFG